MRAGPAPSAFAHSRTSNLRIAPAPASADRDGNASAGRASGRAARGACVARDTPAVSSACAHPRSRALVIPGYRRQPSHAFHLSDHPSVSLLQPVSPHARPQNIVQTLPRSAGTLPPRHINQVLRRMSTLVFRLTANRCRGWRSVLAAAGEPGWRDRPVDLGGPGLRRACGPRNHAWRSKGSRSGAHQRPSR